MAQQNLLSREEVLGGLPAGRARTLLFLIEARTALSAARSQQVAEIFPSEAEALASDQAYLQAIRQSGDLPRQPTIQEIEQYAASWAELAPTNPQVRAAVLQLLGAKYQFTANAIPASRLALGAETDAVQAAYRQRFQQPLATIYAPQIHWRARPAWALSALGNWVEHLPPFWHTCILLMTLSFPQAALALSIALAGVGPLVGVGLIVLFGIINMITVAAIAEAIARNGAIRYGSAFLGRVAADYLGASGSSVMTLAVGGYCALAVIAAALGLANTLASFTPIPAVVWVAALFAINVYRLARQWFKLSLALSLLLAMLVISLLLLLSGLAFTHFQVENLALPGLRNRLPNTPVAWQSVLLPGVLGVLLTSFGGHFCVGAVAKAVLPREPSGRALIGGSVMAFGLLTLIFVFWVLAVSGAVSPAALAGASGTVLVPLAARLGTGAQLLGSLIVLLLSGLISIRAANVLFTLVRERLPALHSNRGSRLTPRVRVWLCLSPLLVIFLIVESLLLTESSSFTRIVSIAGVLAVSLFGGLLPVLLLLASRRKGEVVAAGVRAFVGHPLLISALYALFLGLILLHGLAIWQTPLERGPALALTVGIVLMTVQMVRQGAFTPRTVIELRHDQRAGRSSAFSVTAVGRLLPGAVHLSYSQHTIDCQAATGEIVDFGQLHRATFSLPASAARELKVWVHRVTPEGNSEPLPVQIQVSDAQSTRAYDLRSNDGQTLLPLQSQGYQVQITL